MLSAHAQAMLSQAIEKGNHSDTREAGTKFQNLMSFVLLEVYYLLYLGQASLFGFHWSQLDEEVQIQGQRLKLSSGYVIFVMFNPRGSNYLLNMISSQLEKA